MEFSEDNVRWPQKKSTFKCYLTNENTYIYESIGLGEPFLLNEGPSVGIGCELWSECTDERDIPFLLSVLRETAEGIISNQDVIGLVKKYKYVPLDLEQKDVPFPSEFREYRQKLIGVLLGAPVPLHRKKDVEKKNKNGEFIPKICVKILTRNQFLRIKAGGSKSCLKIVKELVKNKEYNITRINT